MPRINANPMAYAVIVYDIISGENVEIAASDLDNAEANALRKQMFRKLDHNRYGIRLQVTGRLKYKPALESQCQGKVVYDTPKAAFANAKKFIRKIGRKDNKHLSPYKCRYCGYWHIGNSRRETGRKR